MARQPSKRPQLPGVFRSAGGDALRAQTQERFLYFLRILGFFHVGIAFIGGLVSVFFLPPRVGLSSGMVVGANVLLTASLFVGAAVASKRKYTMRTLAVLDWTVILSTVGVVGAVTRNMSEIGGSANLASLALTSTLMLRAAIVPSPPPRTLAIGLAASALSLVTMGPAVVAKGLGPWATPTLVVVVGLIHAVFTSIITAAASGVVYGLFERIEDVVRMGQYELVEKVGEGGMGAVWRAKHAMLRRPTAVKLLGEGRNGEVDLARFEREVQLTSMLTHPNTVAVFDYGRAEDGTLFYAMEYVDGLSLEQLVERYGKVSPRRVVHILRQVAGALVEAHHLGLIHRDIKPANVLLCERGCVPDFVKVVDFGLAKSLVTEATGLSTANLIAGTPAYMAPEMIQTPERIDGRADLYALGVVAYYLLAGRPVFEGSNLIEMCSHHLHTVPIPPSAYTPVPAELEEVVLACLAKRPEDRPQSAAVLVKRLDACAALEPWSEDEATLFWATHRALHPAAA